MLALAAGVVGACTPGEGEEAPRAPEVRLRLDYEVGDTLHYRYRVWGTVTRADTTGGMSPTESYERTMSIEEVATDVTPRGNYLLAWTYRPTGEQEAGHEMPAEFALRVEITPQGRIVDVGDLRSARKALGNLDFKTYLDQTQPVFPDSASKACTVFDEVST